MATYKKKKSATGYKNEDTINDFSPYMLKESDDFPSAFKKWQALEVLELARIRGDSTIDTDKSRTAYHTLTTEIQNRFGIDPFKFNLNKDRGLDDSRESYYPSGKFIDGNIAAENDQIVRDPNLMGNPKFQNPSEDSFMSRNPVQQPQIDPNMQEQDTPFWDDNPIPDMEASAPMEGWGNRKYNPFDGPVPGQSLTETPGNAKWEHPPQYARPQDAADMVWKQLMKPEHTKKVLSLMRMGVPIEALVRTTLFAGFNEGKWTVDTALLIAKPVTSMMVAMAKRAKIPGVKFRMPGAETDPELERLAKMAAKRKLGAPAPESKEEFLSLFDKPQEFA